MTKAEVVIHPDRMRIINTIGGGRLTPRQVAAALPEIPQATLYRHLKLLHDHEILEVVDQRQINGITELTYAVKAHSTRFTREEFAAIPAADHQRYFAVFLGVLASLSNAYFDQPEYDTTADGMTYFIACLNLTPEQRRQLRLDLLSLVETYAKAELPGALPTQLGVAFVPDITKPLDPIQ
jgi:DNA-binding HxlR family transcriptional regulator